MKREPPPKNCGCKKFLEVPDKLVRWFSRHAAFGVSFDRMCSEASKTTSCSRRATWRGVLALQHPHFFGWRFVFLAVLWCVWWLLCIRGMLSQSKSHPSSYWHLLRCYLNGHVYPGKVGHKETWGICACLPEPEFSLWWLRWEPQVRFRTQLRTSPCSLAPCGVFCQDTAWRENRGSSSHLECLDTLSVVQNLEL